MHTNITGLTGQNSRAQASRDLNLRTLDACLERTEEAQATRHLSRETVASTGGKPFALPGREFGHLSLPEQCEMSSHGVGMQGRVTLAQCPRDNGTKCQFLTFGAVGTAGA